MAEIDLHDVPRTPPVDPLPARADVAPRGQCDDKVARLLDLVDDLTGSEVSMVQRCLHAPVFDR